MKTWLAALGAWCLLAAAAVGQADAPAPAAPPEILACATGDGRVAGPAEAYLYALRCGADRAEGFATTFVPDDTRTQLRLRDVPADGRLRAYWLPSRPAEILRREVLTGRIEPLTGRTPEDRTPQKSLACLRALTIDAQVIGLERDGADAVLSLQVLKAHAARQRLNAASAQAYCGVTFDWWRPARAYTLLVVTDATGGDGGLLVGGEAAYLAEIRGIVSARQSAVALAGLVGLALFFGFFVRGLVGEKARLFQGPGGGMSLSRTQIGLFTVVVLTMLVYVMAREGTLGDISTDVLLLIGIVAAGSTGANVTDRFTARLDWENWLWLKREGWLGGAEAKPYRLRQLVTDAAGNFDVFRFQAALFSVVVAVYLMIAGTRGLADITLPAGIMGILGLSQVTYIGGKAVGPPKWADFNAQLAAFRERLSENRRRQVDSRADPETVEAREKLERGFEALFGAPPDKPVAPGRTGLRLRLAEDTRGLFPLRLSLDGTEIAVFAEHVALFEALDLPLRKGTAQQFTLEQTGAQGQTARRAAFPKPPAALPDGGVSEQTLTADAFG